MPISAYARAQNGSAWGSVAARAAVPSPWDAAAVARPRVMGSMKPPELSRRWQVAAPSRPVATTVTAHTGISSCAQGAMHPFFVPQLACKTSYYFDPPRQGKKKIIKAGEIQQKIKTLSPLTAGTLSVSAMGIARATVTERGAAARERSGGRPIARPAAAVAARESSEPMTATL